MATIGNSCNGLLFLEDEGNYYVFNPATARYARLPCPSTKRCIGAMTLAFDPAVSLHYEVYLLHEDKLLWARHTKQDNVPSPKKVVPLEVYSSRTGKWGIREFTPGRCAPGHLYHMVVTSSHCYRLERIIWTPNTYERAFWSSHYWRESIYIHSIANILVILRSSKRTYEMVQLPGEPCVGNAENRFPLPKHSIFASYDTGVHYVTINELHLQVWMLTEPTDGHLGWRLAHNANLRLHADMVWSPILELTNVTWGLIRSRGGSIKLIQDDDGYGNVKDNDDGAGAYDSDYSWNSDEENFVDVDKGSTNLVQSTCPIDCRIIGLHPHKKALILLLHHAVVVYHLDTSKIQVLGYENVFMDEPVGHCHVNGSFIYRGCYADVLPAGGKISKP
jgi:hypothetical protein